MQKQFFAISPVLALLVVAACASKGNRQEGPVTEGALNAGGAFCGGVANIQCPAGQHCRFSGYYVDAPGTCVGLLPGEEGSACGGTTGVSCWADLVCQPDDVPEDSEDPPPGAVGIIVPEDAGSHPPPGWMGMPALDGGSGPPPGAVGLPIIPDTQGKCVRKTSGPPPGAMGMPHLP